MERCLGVMAGAGVLPGCAAAEARRQGWRIVAFAFDDAPGLAEFADRVVSCRLTDIRSVLAEVAAQRIEAALFVGKFWKQSALSQVRGADDAGRRLADRGLSDAALAEMVVATLGAMGVQVLDQRLFLGPLLFTADVLAGRIPSGEQWEEVRAGWRLARSLAAQGIGQTLVRSRGVTVAVEAAEGTDETIRRGTALAGPGAVVVKAVAPDHDYRFDIPTIGPATLEVMAAGGAAVLAVARGKVLLVERETAIRLAERASIALVGIDEGQDDLA
ncbi:MAG: UDP-2,3-diacylglucosamine diphosphatase LpxI [Candidatus Rokubacteria bacterium]|nr:UDP-2,3-diacylglucosamine diphosphatase LpxI [Candidatus Rokubacteria bacterium]MBI3105440.1 UDP-2,3-diacylglucosamine diphosphatase LpxI [Candidatus Rokubacteria bacterium]